MLIVAIAVFQNEMQALLQHYSVNEGLVAEVLTVAIAVFQNEMQALLQHYSVNEGLVAEVLTVAIAVFQNEMHYSTLSTRGLWRRC